MSWNSELPTEDGIYWIKAPVIGSPGKYWRPFIAECRVNGPNTEIDVYQIGMLSVSFIKSETGYRFSEKVECPD